MQQVEIRIKGHIDRTWSDWLGNLDIDHTADGETLLTGAIRDQAALRGLICQLADLGLSLMSVAVGKNSGQPDTGVVSRNGGDK
jgi:hypothetical protein